MVISPVFICIYWFCNYKCKSCCYSSIFQSLWICHQY